MSACEREHLCIIGPPTTFVGVGLQSLIKAADEELLGSWAAVPSDLITFLMSKGMPVYSQPANALDGMIDTDDNPSNDQPITTPIQQ